MPALVGKVCRIFYRHRYSAIAFKLLSTVTEAVFWKFYSSHWKSFGQILIIFSSWIPDRSVPLSTHFFLIGQWTVPLFIYIYSFYFIYLLTRGGTCLTCSPPWWRTWPARISRSRSSSTSISPGTVLSHVRSLGKYVPACLRACDCVRTLRVWVHALKTDSRLRQIWAF